jgi:hypothetical protein
MRKFLQSAYVNAGARAEKGPISFYKDALTTLEIFVDKGDTLADSPSMVRTAYRSFLATVITTPKAVNYAPSNRYIVWKKLQAKHLSPVARNLLWQISRNILPTRTFFKT